MANDVSGYGLRVRLIASTTFPAGVTISQFADDVDPFDLPAITVLGNAMGVNGDLVSWTTAVPLTINIGVIPDSDDDRNLAILLEANRSARGKYPARDTITLSVLYPSGRTLLLNNGKLLTGMPGNSIASAGRMKGKTYGFVFEGMVRT